MDRGDIYYKAMCARDHRFDGKFFVGVKTTGIYCRPICPAKPLRRNVEFFPSYLAAERAGYRPCLRCRPECAPRSPAWIGTSALVRRALRFVPESGHLNEDSFAALFGVGARHLRRLFREELGKTPRQLFFENRLYLAHKLLSESSMPVTEVAHAAGFRSVRRFNDSFRKKYKKSPRELRRRPARSGLELSLAYRPPFDFSGLLHFYRAHRVGELEWFEGEVMHRLVLLNGKAGEIAIANDAGKSQLLLKIDFPDPSGIQFILNRVRAMFDLDSDPIVIANSLETDSATKLLWKKYPGVRLPSGWDGFETAIASILGQLVSVDRGRALVADLIQLLGEEREVRGKKVKFFPSAARIAASDLTALKTTGARKKTLIEFSRLVAAGAISLEATQDVEEFLKKVRAVKGIGPWTANYMAMKVLRHTDAFPDTDLILARALELHPLEAISRMSPWRGYAAALYWREYSGKEQK